MLLGDRKSKTKQNFEIDDVLCVALCEGKVLDSRSQTLDVSDSTNR